MEPFKQTSISPPQQYLSPEKPCPLLRRMTEENSLRNVFQNGFCYQEYSINAKKIEHIKVSLTNREGFYFIYCWKGNLTISTEQIEEIIPPFQSAFIYNKTTDDVTINLNPDTENQFCVISLNEPKSKHLVANNIFYDNFKESFFNLTTGRNDVHIERPYLKLLEKINSLSRISKDDSASELIMKGLILQVLGLKMEQIHDSFLDGRHNHGSLTKQEIRRVQTVSDLISENSSLDYSMEFLCRETSLSPAKLQEGFKKIHGRTVMDYIRNVRLEKSIDLIRTTDLSISEIVYSIGLNSRSYFSKIFKNKYLCSPKDFQDIIKLTGAEA